MSVCQYGQIDACKSDGTNFICIYIAHKEYLTSWKNISHLESGIFSIAGALLQILAPRAQSLNMFYKQIANLIIDKQAGKVIFNF